MTTQPTKEQKVEAQNDVAKAAESPDATAALKEDIKHLTTEGIIPGTQRNNDFALTWSLIQSQTRSKNSSKFTVSFPSIFKAFYFVTLLIS